MFCAHVYRRKNVPRKTVPFVVLTVTSPGRVQPQKKNTRAGYFEKHNVWAWHPMVPDGMEFLRETFQAAHTPSGH